MSLGPQWGCTDAEVVFCVYRLRYTQGTLDCAKQMSKDSKGQRPCITRLWASAVFCLTWLGADWKSGGGGSCKGCTVLPAYAQSCPVVIWGVLQLWRRRIAKWCTLLTASTKLSISGTRRASSLPYFSLVRETLLKKKMDSVQKFCN